MDTLAVYDRVKTYLENNQEQTLTPPNEIKEDISALADKIKRLKSKFPKLKGVDLSDHLYSMLM